MTQDMSDVLSEKKIDLIDVSYIESGSPVDQEIKKTGVILYASKK